MGDDIAITPDPQTSAEDQDDGKQKGKKNSRRASNKPNATLVAPKSVKFEGRCEELKGYVYDCSNPRQAADEFTRTTREIAEYTGVKFGAEVKLTIETLRKPVLPLPPDPPVEATATEKRIWERRVDAYVKAEVDLKADLLSCLWAML